MPPVVTKYHLAAVFLIGATVTIFSISYVLIHGIHPLNLLKTYLDPEKVVIVERQIQQTPVPLPETQQQRIPIFVYHSVRPRFFGETALQDAYDVTPELFEQQLQYLQQNAYNVITTNDLAISASGTVYTLKKNPVMLTFDDGWESQYEYAYPLLKKYNMKGVFYIYTQPIGAHMFLTWDQVAEMRDNGMVIGSHTLTHPFLKKLTEDQLAHEIVDSKIALERKLGSPIRDFASPYGYSNDAIVAIVKKAGYRTARTLYKSSYHDDIFKLRGYLVTDDISDYIYILNQK